MFTTKKKRRQIPSHKRLLAFARQVAGLTKDSECAECHTDLEENPECGNHSLFDMPNDDAVDTLHSLITGARELTAHRAGVSR